MIRGISGGQRKRVTIGVALTTDPSLIVMDYPTVGLDANTSLEVCKVKHVLHALIAITAS